MKDDSMDSGCSICGLLAAQMKEASGGSYRPRSSRNSWSWSGKM